MKCRNAEALKRWKVLSVRTVANRDILPITDLIAAWTKFVEMSGAITKSNIVNAYASAVAEVGEPGPFKRSAAITLIGELAYYGQTFRSIARKITDWPAGVSK